MQLGASGEHRGEQLPREPLAGGVERVRQPELVQPERHPARHRAAHPAAFDDQREAGACGALAERGDLRVPHAQH
jgi:hypothetical protein